MASRRTRLPPAQASSSSSSHPSNLPSLHNPKTQEVFENVISGRKNWKALRGGEIVWPPELEAALIEGLERYVPDDSRETRILGRYPMRNRFLSDYIYCKTGIRRTAKQVGSRLQQLRDTATGKKLMKLLSPCAPVKSSSRRHHSPSEYSETESSSDGSSLPTTPVDVKHTFPNNMDSIKVPRTVVCIDILPQQSAARPVSDDLPSTTSEVDVVRTSPHPRPFHSIDPTITFVGPAQLSAQAAYTVNNRGVTVFKETVSLTSVGPAPGRTDGSLLYSTKLIPGFWDRISESPDPTQYSITQDVVRDDGSLSTVFSALYRFAYSTLLDDKPRISPSPAPSDRSEVSGMVDVSSAAAFDSFFMDIAAALDQADDLESILDSGSTGSLDSMTCIGGIMDPSMVPMKCESPDLYDLSCLEVPHWDTNCFEIPLGYEPIFSDDVLSSTPAASPSAMYTIDMLQKYVS